jgi:hypothetical protein
VASGAIAVGVEISVIVGRPWEEKSCKHSNRCHAEADENDLFASTDAEPCHLFYSFQ